MGHFLFYLTFNPDADTKLQVNHIDEDKLNNRLDNLNLMTAKENINILPNFFLHRLNHFY